MFIGTNNRYGVVHPIEDKKVETILGSIKKFVEKYKPIKLTSDDIRLYYQNLY